MVVSTSFIAYSVAKTLLLPHVLTQIERKDRGAFYNLDHVEGSYELILKGAWPSGRLSFLLLLHFSFNEG